MLKRDGGKYFKEILRSPFFECFKSFSLAEHTGTFDTCVKSPRVLYFLQKV